MDFSSLQMRILLSNGHFQRQPIFSGAGETSLSFMSAKKTMGKLWLVSSIVFYSNGYNLTQRMICSVIELCQGVLSVLKHNANVRDMLQTWSGHLSISTLPMLRALTRNDFYAKLLRLQENPQPSSSIRPVTISLNIRLRRPLLTVNLNYVG